MDNESVAIRLLVPGDTIQLSRVTEVLYDIAREGQTRYGEKRESIEFKVESVGSLLFAEECGCAVLIAENVESDQLLGVAVTQTSISTWSSGKILNIHDLFVYPEYRGIGVGKKLLNRINNLADEMDCIAITLETNAANLAAIKLYLRKGFGFVATSLDSIEKVVELAKLHPDLQVVMKRELK